MAGHSVGQTALPHVDTHPTLSVRTDGAVASAFPLSPSGDGPRASGAVIPPLSVRDESPRPLSRKQQDKLHDGIKAEYWSVIETWKGATYTRDQRGYDCHTSGIDAMLANGVLPDDLRAKLGKLDAFQRRTFTVNKLYLDWWNNLDEVQPAKPVSNGKPASTPYNESRPRRRNFTQEAREEARMRGEASA